MYGRRSTAVSRNTVFVMCYRGVRRRLIVGKRFRRRCETDRSDRVCSSVPTVPVCDRYVQNRTVPHIRAPLWPVRAGRRNQSPAGTDRRAGRSLSVHCRTSLAVVAEPTRSPPAFADGPAVGINDKYPRLARRAAGIGGRGPRQSLNLPGRRERVTKRNDERARYLNGTDKGVSLQNTK